MKAFGKITIGIACAAWISCFVLGVVHCFDDEGCHEDDDKDCQPDNCYLKVSDSAWQLLIFIVGLLIQQALQQQADDDDVHHLFHHYDSLAEDANVLWQVLHRDPLDEDQAGKNDHLTKAPGMVTSEHANTASDMIRRCILACKSDGEPRSAKVLRAKTRLTMFLNDVVKHINFQRVQDETGVKMDIDPHLRKDRWPQPTWGKDKVKLFITRLAICQALVEPFDWLWHQRNAWYRRDSNGSAACDHGSSKGCCVDRCRLATDCWSACPSGCGRAPPKQTTTMDGRNQDRKMTDTSEPAPATYARSLSPTLAGAHTPACNATSAASTSTHPPTSGPDVPHSSPAFTSPAFSPIELRASALDIMTGKQASGTRSGKPSWGSKHGQTTTVHRPLRHVGVATALELLKDDPDPFIGFDHVHRHFHSFLYWAVVDGARDPAHIQELSLEAYSEFEGKASASYFKRGI